MNGFTQESWEAISSMLFGENKLEGQCGQRKKREATKSQRSPAQRQADKARAQARQGRDTMSSATRSEAAKKAAATRAKCKGTASPRVG